MCLSVIHTHTHTHTELVTQVQILHEAVGVSLHANAFEEGMSPSFLSLAMDKL